MVASSTGTLHFLSAGAISVPDARRVHSAVKSVKRPKVVKSPEFEAEFGEDSTGAPAIWIRFYVDEDLNPSDRKITDMNRFADKVRSKLLALDLPHWPYIEFKVRSPANQA